MFSLRATYQWHDFVLPEPEQLAGTAYTEHGDSFRCNRHSQLGGSTRESGYSPAVERPSLAIRKERRLLVF
jgi:hypothetical protein